MAHLISIAAIIRYLVFKEPTQNLPTSFIPSHMMKMNGSNFFFVLISPQNRRRLWAPFHSFPRKSVAYLQKD